MPSIIIKGSDTYINRDNRDTNFKNASERKVGDDGLNTFGNISLFYFNIPNVLKDNVEIQSITFRAKKNAFTQEHRTWTYKDSHWYTNYSYSYPSGFSGEYMVSKDEVDDSYSVTYNNCKHLTNDGNTITGEYFRNFDVSSGEIGEYLDIPIDLFYGNGSKLQLTAEYLTLCIFGRIDGSTLRGDECNNYYGSFASGSSELIIEYASKFPTVTLTNPLNTTISNISPVTLEWNFSEAVESGQKSYEIQWSSDGGVNWKIITNESSNQYHEFPANTFPEGTIQWKVTCINNFNLESNVAEGSFVSHANVPSVEISYPVDINILNKNSTIFMWTFAELVVTGQKSYEIQWSSDGGINWNTITNESSNHYHEFPANTFPTGTIRWKVKCISNAERVSDYAEVAFVAVGSSAAPSIQGGINGRAPLYFSVNTGIGGHDTWEARIKKDGQIIYETGLNGELMCHEYFTPGKYILEIRGHNRYGMLSEWDSHVFTIEPEGTVKCASEVCVGILSGYGIQVIGVTNEKQGKHYCIRRECDSKTEMFLAGEFTGVISDYKVPLNVPYQYAIRTVINYNGKNIGGVIDSEWYDVIAQYDGILVHDADDFENYVEINSGTENEFTIRKSDSYNKSIYHCLGKTYPVKDQTEWKETVRNVSGWVSDEDYEKLRNMMLRNVYYRATGEAFLADMELQLEGDYVGGGKIVRLTFTRLYESKVVPYEYRY